MPQGRRRWVSQLTKSGGEQIPQSIPRLLSWGIKGLGGGRSSLLRWRPLYSGLPGTSCISACSPWGTRAPGHPE